MLMGKAGGNVAAAWALRKMALLKKGTPRDGLCS